MSSKLQLVVSHYNHQWWRRLLNACEVEAGANTVRCNLQVKRDTYLGVLSVRCYNKGAI